MFSKIENIKECIKFLEDNHSNISINDSEIEWYGQAIEDLKSYLEDQEEYVESCYHEHFNDHVHSESKYCF